MIKSIHYQFIAYMYIYTGHRLFYSIHANIWKNMEDTEKYF